MHLDEKEWGPYWYNVIIDFTLYSYDPNDKSKLVYQYLKDGKETTWAFEVSHTLPTKEISLNGVIFPCPN